MQEEVINKLREEFQKILDHFRKELSGIRTGRAHPSLVEDISVECYGSRMPLRQMASISMPETKTILVSPWDKNLLKDAQKAIELALELSAQNDGGTIRISLPALTEERRKDLFKIVGKKLEEAKVSMRNIRHDILDEVENIEEIGKTEIDLLKKKIQSEVDKFNGESQKMAEEKENEIMKV